MRAKRGSWIRDSFFLQNLEHYTNVYEQHTSIYKCNEQRLERYCRNGLDEGTIRKIGLCRFIEGCLVTIWSLRSSSKCRLGQRIPTQDELEAVSHGGT